MKKLVISLVTYNAGAYMQPCLASIAEQTFTEYELVILDNASSDGTRDVIKRGAPDARIILSKENNGFANGHNEVIRKTESEYVCVLNQDVVLESGYLQGCVQYLESHPTVASVTGLLIRVPSLTDKGLCDTVDSYGLDMSWTAHIKNYKQSTRVADIHKEERVLGVPATAAVYRRSALEDAARDGGEVFDEDFFMYKEDVDLALRLRLRGWGAAAIPHARAYHIRTTDPALLKRPSTLINQWSYRNQFYILIKDVTTKQWITQGLLIMAYEVAKFFYLLFFESSTLKVLPDVWRNRKKMFAKRAIIMK